MRFKNLRAHKMGPFDDVSIDLDGIDGPLVALVGANGAGKSTALEMLYGCLYRQTPTRGPLAGLATARDSWVESTIVNGTTRTLRHSFDVISGKGEATITDENGTPVTASAKVRDFDGYGGTHFPPRAVYETSEFLAQGSNGFLEKGTAEKKAIILRTLDLERMERMAEKARENARAKKQALLVTQARLTDERARVSSLDAVTAELGRLRADRAAAVETLGVVAAELDAVRERAAEAKIASQRYHEAIGHKAKAEAELRAATVRAADLEARIAKNRGVLARGAEISAARQRDAEIGERVAVLNDPSSGLIARAFVSVAEAGRDIDRAKSAQAVATIQRDNAQGQKDRAIATLLAAPEAEKAAADVPALIDRVQEAADEVALWEARLEQARQSAQDVRDERIGILRGALEIVSSIDKGADFESDTAVARDAIDADDKVVADAAAAPAIARSAKASLADAKAALEGSRATLAKTERLAARAAEMAAATTASAAADDDLSEAAWKLEEAAKRLGEASAAKAAAEAEVAPLRAELATLIQERAELAPLLALAGPLDQAATRLAELEPQLAEATAAQYAATETIAAIVLPDPAVVVDVAPVEARVAEADKRARSLEAQIAGVEARLAATVEALARIDALTAESAAIEEELSDWVRLGDDLGAQGLQALEIDCVGPTISGIANDLLHAAFGSRFTLRLDTVKRSADNKKDIEVFDVNVIDAVRGRDGTAESLSGGERVIVGEAIALALMTVSCGRAGVTGSTLIRDETGAALDAENGRNYVAMLRRAGELVGAAQILFVTHSAELAALADARIVVADGGARVETGAAA